MTTDLYMLAWTAGVTGLMWVIYILARMQVAGPVRTLTYAGDNDPLPAWADRAKRAHYNAIENLAPFAALVLVAHIAGEANATTATAAIVFFWARVVHYVGHISGAPYIRTLAFAVGWAAMMVIFLAIVT